MPGTFTFTTHNNNREKRKKRHVSGPEGEMSLLVSGVRGLKEPAHRADMVWVAGQSRDASGKPPAAQAAEGASGKGRIQAGLT